jgi:methyl-galactoside transport system substrate-binding protein
MKRYLNIFILIIFIVLSISGNIGCGKTNIQEVEINNNDDIKIGVLIYRFDDPFIASIRDIIKKEVEVLNTTSTRKIVLHMVDGKNQQDIQYDQIDTMINEGYDVLAINLVDRSAASGVIDKAKQANIPIVFFNREPVQVDMARWDRIYYVGAKAEESGMIQGKIAAKHWKLHPCIDKNGDGVMQYVILEGQAGHQDAILRSKYAINTVQKEGISVEKLAKDTANWQRSEAKDKIATWLENFGSDIEFIFCNNDAMALGTVDAMKESELISNNKLIPVIGVDATREAIEAFKNGEIIGTVYNDNVTQGKIVVHMAYYLALNKNPADYIKDIVYGTYYWTPYYEYTEEEE